MRGSIIKRSQRSWSLIFRDAHGKQKWVTFRPEPGLSPREARQAAECALARLVVAHGATTSRPRVGVHRAEYNAWRNARYRCTDPRHPRFKDYGGRGIAMCAAWRDSFEQFFADIGPRPPGMTLDRIDNDRGYEPGNVRWADRSTQSRNQRRIRRTSIARLINGQG